MKIQQDGDTPMHIKEEKYTCVCFYGATAERVLNVLAYRDENLFLRPVRKPKDCADLDPKRDPSGVYRIYPYAGSGFKVYCDMKTDGGRWTVLIRRMDGSENFNKNWIGYEHGFGDLNREFWLVGGFSGNAGDAFTYHNGMKFSTPDQDNDNTSGNCANVGNRVGGGWWYNSCDTVCFTFSYANNNKGLTGEALIQWETWKSSAYSLKYASMMIRRV
ncbi:unnamed protein product [Mytilus edulis]|uniref:Fibrinogen C-terminal domain-containing protein n=1 Tax=Mytilus edulis TaxID=6550 RepID=A0A8S3U3F7_MYTED|nr:unnamed protein product [Mytilus edulis]